MVSKPNDWSRSVVAASKSTQLTEDKLTQKNYWLAFIDYLENNNSDFKTTKAQPTNWINIPLAGKSGIHLCAIASMFNTETNSWSGGENRVELYIAGASPKAYFQQLYEKKDEIEAAIGETCIWKNTENKKSCKVYVVNAAKVRDEKDWNNQHQWLLEKLVLFKKGFGPHLPDLIDD